MEAPPPAEHPPPVPPRRQHQEHRPDPRPGPTPHLAPLRHIPAQHAGRPTREQRPRAIRSTGGTPAKLRKPMSATDASRPRERPPTSRSHTGYTHANNHEPTRTRRPTTGAGSQPKRPRGSSERRTNSDVATARRHARPHRSSNTASRQTSAGSPAGQRDGWERQTAPAQRTTHPTRRRSHRTPQPARTVGRAGGVVADPGGRRCCSCGGAGTGCGRVVVW